MIFKKSCSYKFGNTHIKTPVLESLFNKPMDSLKGILQIINAKKQSIDRFLRKKDKILEKLIAEAESTTRKSQSSR